MTNDQVHSQLLTNTLTSANHLSELNRTIAQNLAQGLGIVQTASIQEKSAVSDDSGLLMALQSAVGVPRQGSHGSGGGGS